MIDFQSGLTEDQARALKERLAKNPDVGLIIGSSIGAIVPHLVLTKLLVSKGVLSKAELAAAYDMHLDAGKYPKGLSECLSQFGRL